MTTRDEALAKMGAWVEEVREYLEDREDITGTGQANAAMRLVMSSPWPEVRPVLEGERKQTLPRSVLHDIACRLEADVIYGDEKSLAKKIRAFLADAAPTESAMPKGALDMLLFCPRCQMQHVDAPDVDWANPPHATHTCKGCGLLWRPSNGNTNGVAGIGSPEQKHVERFLATDPRFHAAPQAQGDAATPRTDAQHATWRINDDPYTNMMRHAQRLERELAEADAAAQRWWRAASPYATPEALRDALAAQQAGRSHAPDGWVVTMPNGRFAAAYKDKDTALLVAERGEPAYDVKPFFYSAPY